MQQSAGQIGRWQGAGLMATTLLGTGVFILPQLTITLAGSGALLAWSLLTLALIPITLVFALLAGRYPNAAGPAYFVGKAFGQTLGHAIGLSFLLVVAISAPAAIVMTFKFVQTLIPLSGWALLSAQLLSLLGLWLLNLRGIEISATLQFFLTLAIVLMVILLLTACGLKPELTTKLELATLTANPDKILQALSIGFWSFLGVEAVTHLVADFRQPQKDLLPAMATGVLLVGVIYIACSLLLLLIGIKGPVAMTGAFDTLMGGYGPQVIGSLGIASGFAAINVYTASVSRLMWSFSNDGVLPRWLCQRNSFRVPVRALGLILSVIALVLTLTHLLDLKLAQLIAWSNGVFVIIYLLTSLSAIRLLSKKWLPLILLSSALCLLIILSLGWAMSYALILEGVILLILRLKPRK